MSDESDTDNTESAASYAHGHNTDDNTECAIKGDKSRNSSAADGNTKHTTTADIATGAAKRCAIGFASIFRGYASSNCGAPREGLDVEEAEEARHVPSSYWYDGWCSARWVVEGPPRAHHGEGIEKEEEGQRRLTMRFYDWRADPRMQYSFYDWRIGSSSAGECCVPQSNGQEHCAGYEEEKALAPKEEEEEVSQNEMVNRFCYDYPWSDISSLTEQREGTSPLQD